MNELEQRWRDLGEFIREQRRVGQLSLRKLSEMAGISNPYLSQIERGLRKPSAEILQQIARALEISSESLYVRAGILEEREGDHDVVGEIRRDPYITEDQKKTLIHIYNSFASETRAAHGPDAGLDDDLVGGGGADQPADAPGNDSGEDDATVRSSPDGVPEETGEATIGGEILPSMAGTSQTGKNGSESPTEGGR